MNNIALAFLITCIILIIVYNTDAGHKLSDKCNSTAGLLTDTVTDFFGGNPEEMYKETKGDFYNMKAKMTLKKSLAIPPEKRTAKDDFRIGNIYRYYVKNPELAREYYNRTVERLRQKPQEADNNMIDRLEDFNDTQLQRELPHLRDLIAEDRIVRQIEDLGEVVRHHGVIEIPIPQNAQFGARPGLNPPNDQPRNFGFTTRYGFQTNVKIVGEENKDEYFKKLQEWTNEPQNVHDSNITSDVAKSYHMI